MAPTEKQAKQNRALELAGKKTPKARVQRYLKNVGPQLQEQGKSTLLLKGTKCSHNMMLVLKELAKMQAPNCKLLSKTNPITPFHDTNGQQSLEFLMTKNDCSLAVLASHNKKRPNNLVFMRTFDHQILDMAELGVTYFKSMQDYGGDVAKKRTGSKPLLLFQGDAWQQNTDFSNLQNLLTDVYRGDVVDHLVLTGIDHVIAFTATTTAASAADEQNNNNNNNNHPGNLNNNIRVHQRTYHVQLKKSPTTTTTGHSKIPAAYLQPCGPDLDFVLRRTSWADPELARLARQQPAQNKRKANNKKRKKNQTTNLFGETLGRLHIEKQNVDHMGGRKSKAIRRAQQFERQEEKEALEEELAREKQQIMGQEEVLQADEE